MFHNKWYEWHDHTTVIFKRKSVTSNIKDSGDHQGSIEIVKWNLVFDLSPCRHMVITE